MNVVLSRKRKMKREEVGERRQMDFVGNMPEQEQFALFGVFGGKGGEGSR